MHLKQIRKIVETEGIVFLTYGGILSQTLITGMIDSLEKEAEDNKLKMGVANNIFIIFIELTQNMMNYTMRHNKELNVISDGLILVARDRDQENTKNYKLHSNNIISKEAKETLEIILQEIISLNKEEVKKRYRELRKDGKNKHRLGAGIGFFEIAKRCDKIDYDFEIINKGQFYFNLNVTINIKD